MPSTTTTESHSLTYPAEGATGWYATWEALMQQITDYLDDINDIRIATIKDNNGNEAVVINTTASAVNHLGVTNAATGNNPMLASEGSDSNVGLILGDSNGNEVIVAESTASAVNEVTITNAATANDPKIEATGGDTNINLQLQGKGTGVLKTDNDQDADMSVILQNDSSGTSARIGVSMNNDVASSEAGIKLGSSADSDSDFQDTLVVFSNAQLDGGVRVKTSHSTANITLETNGGDAVVVDQDGHVTMPRTSAFQVHPSADITDVTGNGTSYDVVFDTETFDQNADFNSSTGVFTAPVTGRYLFSWNMAFEDVNATTRGTARIVTSNRNYQIIDFNNSTAQIDIGSSELVVFSGSMLVDMDAADTAKININFNGEGSDIIDVSFDSSAFSYWGGYLAC